MAYNFLRGNRDQPFLLPPDLRDWLPANHLAWFILDVTDQLDLEPFLRAYRTDGHGHPAYASKTLLGVLLYAYCIGVRSSRQIERRCREDLALEPMLQATATTLAAAGIAERPEAALADSGYWSIDNLTIPTAPELLIPPARHGRQGKPRKDGKPSESRSDGLRAAMKAKLKSEDGKARYAKRRETIEPVFGQIPDQGAAGRAAVPPPRHARLQRGVEAAVRRPLP